MRRRVATEDDGLAQTHLACNLRSKFRTYFVRSNAKQIRANSGQISSLRSKFRPNLVQISTTSPWPRSSCLRTSLLQPVLLSHVVLRYRRSRAPRMNRAPWPLSPIGRLPAPRTLLLRCSKWRAPRQLQQAAALPRLLQQAPPARHLQRRSSPRSSVIAALCRSAQQSRGKV